MFGKENMGRTKSSKTHGYCFWGGACKFYDVNDLGGTEGKLSAFWVVFYGLLLQYSIYSLLYGGRGIHVERFLL